VRRGGERRVSGMEMRVAAGGSGTGSAHQAGAGWRGCGLGLGLGLGRGLGLGTLVSRPASGSEMYSVCAAASSSSVPLCSRSSPACVRATAAAAVAPRSSADARRRRSALVGRMPCCAYGGAGKGGEKEVRGRAEGG
jgi:hypothetical protein